jgi:hypothetical protein
MVNIRFWPPLSKIEKTGILRLLSVIELEDRRDGSGSCGDGSFEYKQRQSDHKDRITALRVIKDIISD